MSILVAVLEFVGLSSYNIMLLAPKVDLLMDQIFRLKQATDSTTTPEKV